MAFRNEGATGTSRVVKTIYILTSFITDFKRLTETDLFETRNRLHIYSRAYCTECGPRYQPLSRAPFILRGINLIHLPSFEFACYRSDLFKASWFSRLARKKGIAHYIDLVNYVGLGIGI